MSAQCRTETLDGHTRGDKDKRSYLADVGTFGDSA